MFVRHTEPYLVESEPATEWLLGGPVQKVSPQYLHGLLQRTIAERLGVWAAGRGRVATEWRFWLTPPGELARYVVPDIAYLSYAALSREARSEAAEPRVPPTVAIEILSPRDRNVLVQHKLDCYLRSGTALVVVVDPDARAVALHDVGTARVARAGDTISHAVLPGFAVAIDDLFAVLED